MTLLRERRQLIFAAAAWCGAGAMAADQILARPAAADDAAPTFRALRPLRGHFDGGAWNNDVDRWQGRKHVAMQRLADQALRDHASAALLRQWMGEPDATLQPGHAAHARAIEMAQWLPVVSRAPQADAKIGVLVVYRWRGQHDQLAFVLEHDRVVAAGWLYERE